MDWFRRNETTPLKGVAVVLHGLNLDPARMAAAIAALNEAGIDALRLSLRGHGDNFRRREGMDAVQSRLEEFKEVTRALWTEETRRGCGEAQAAAQREGAPLFLVGFSYGGLIGLDLLADGPEVSFDRALLFAPALRLRGWDYAVRLFSSFPRMVIPTLAPAAYLANPGTPVAAYNALFETLDHFESRLGPRLNIPTLVVMDPGDELVCLDGLKRLAEEHRLSRWRFFTLHRRRSLLNGMLRHIVIDEASVGRHAWAEIRKEMTAHLLAHRA
jgi:pimeloyl-ACP methyl ester carboxylesterase